MKKNSIAVKIFIYTFLAMMFLVIVTAALFSNQFLTLSRAVERERIYEAYQPLVSVVEGKSRREIEKNAQNFYEENQSFEFIILNKDNSTLFSTPNAVAPVTGKTDFYYVVYEDKEYGYSVVAQTRPTLKGFYHEMLIRVVVVVLFMLLFALLLAYFFTRQLANPIKKLAENTKRMSALEEVPQTLPDRKDELGELAADVHFMYGELKKTIASQKAEIVRERQMEESQRYFFSAASHELKTPIAATSVLLEGMLANVGDYSNHPKYLRECLKLMDVQSKLVSEILETVKLIDGKIKVAPRKTELLPIVNETLLSYQALIEELKQTVDVQVASDVKVLADQNILRKVLSNVLSNAIQYSPEGAVVSIEVQEKENHSLLIIRNSPACIPEDVLEKIFDPFYKGDLSRTKRTTSSGLGLTIVKKMLDLSEVPFELKNEAGGVAFNMQLPKIKD